MAVLTRTNYIPNTLIESAKVNVDFNQLVDLLSGVSTTKDALIKFSDANNPVLRVDQLGAGVIQQWLQNGAVKTVIDNSGFLYVGKGITDASPTSGLINGTGGSGSNIAGGNLILAGGKATGNAVPGVVNVQYPLIGASGSTLQSLSAASYPVKPNLYSSTNTFNIGNTTTETAVLAGLSSAAGSSNSIEAGFTRIGTLYRVRLWGNVTTTGTPTLRIKLKLGTTVLGDTTAVTMNNNTGGRFWLEFLFRVTSLGATGAFDCFTHFEYSSVTQGAATMTYIVDGNSGTVDTTSTQTLDVTIQWGTASASNAFNTFGATIDRYR